MDHLGEVFEAAGSVVLKGFEEDEIFSVWDQKSLLLPKIIWQYTNLLEINCITPPFLLIYF